MKRRSFIKHAAHSLAIPGFLSAFNNKSFGNTLDAFLHLANETDRVLVLIYLEGGNDGLNTVIPLTNYSGLTKVRPHVVMPEQRLLKLDGKDFALHPSLVGFRNMFEEGKLQVVQSVGYPDQNFSHFRSTDIWMSASDADDNIPTGWTGRYLEAAHPQYPDAYPNANFPDPLAVEIGYGASMLFQGERAGASMVINNTNAFYQLVSNTVDQVPDTMAGDRLKHIRLIAQQSQKYGASIRKAADKIGQQKPYPDTRLGNQLKIVSRLVAGGLKTPLYLVRMGGYDTHDNQVDAGDKTKGEHADLLKNLNDSVMAFMADLEFQGVADRVMGMTFSEFGRRIVSNASLGTDHGSAAPLFIFGNMSYGGAQGKTPIIKGTEVYQDNLKMEVDFRQVYGSLLSQWLKADEGQRLAATFRDFDQIPVVKNAVVTSIQDRESVAIKFYPNPVRDFATLKLDAEGWLKVDLIDGMGRNALTLFDGLVVSSPAVVSLDLSRVPTGRYVLKISNGSRQWSHHVIKL
jgi:uncharacterized protein (DUF1501 family)